jgi:actin-related protein
LCLLASGKTTGIVIDSGYEVTRMIPVYEGYTIKNAILSMDVGGKHLTDHLKKLLNEHGHTFNSYKDHQIVRDIKEKLCYVSKDYDYDLASSEPKSYELPVGNVITANKELFTCPEALFKPDLAGIEEVTGIHETTYNSICKCDVDVRSTMYSNIVLAGGSTLFPDIDWKLWLELKNLTYVDMKIKVAAPANRIYSAWVGGSMIAEMSSMQEKWITLPEYEENGPSVVHRKCLA